jgi:DNA-binding NarL/FixJ family response regulator
MARDLHDEVLQDLAYALTATQLVQGAVGDDAAEERLGQAIEALKRAGRGVRDAIYDLRAEDERKDLGEVLEALSIGDRPAVHTEPGLETRSGMDSTSTGEPEEGLDDGVARVLLVEDHASFRDAIASVFEGEPGYTVVGQAGSLAEARELLDGVDIAVIDLALPDGFGGEIVEELRVRNPQAQALVLSAYSERREVARAVESGAAGVLHKSVGMEEVLDAVRRLKAGDTILPLEEVVELLRYASSRKVEEQEGIEAIARLTQREREVLQLLAEGLDSRGIAERLNISVKTERHHAASILAKFGAHSRLQALVFALRHDIVRVT